VKSSTTEDGCSEAKAEPLIKIAADIRNNFFIKPYYKAKPEQAINVIITVL